MHFQFKLSPGDYCIESHYFYFDKKYMCFNYEENCKSFIFYNIQNVIIESEQLDIKKKELKYLDGYNLNLNFEMFKCGGEWDSYLQNDDYKEDNYFAMPDLFKLIHISIKEIEEHINVHEGLNLEFDYDESRLIYEWENYTFRPDHW